MGCAKHDSNVRFISYGEVAIGRGRHWGKRLPSGDRRSRFLGGTGREGDRFYARSRDQEIAPTGEVSGGGRDQEIAPTGEVSGGGRDQEIAPTAVRDGECVAIGRRGRDQEIVSTRRSRDQEIAPTGEVSGGGFIGGRGRDQEIAPTGIGRSSLKKTKRWSFPHRFAG